MTQRGDEARERILTSIPRLANELGTPPTIDEIAAAISLSRSATFKHLKRLRADGKVDLRRRFSGWTLV